MSMAGKDVTSTLEKRKYSRILRITCEYNKKDQMMFEHQSVKYNSRFPSRGSIIRLG